MPSYYATPAAANYSSPPAHNNHRQRGLRVCDTCGSTEQPTVRQFRLCGGCMTTNYCSPECQKKHWPSHKAICQHTMAQVAATKQQPIGADYPDENIAKLLRRFTSQHTTLLAGRASRHSSLNACLPTSANRRSSSSSPSIPPATPTDNSPSRAHTSYPAHT